MKKLNKLQINPKKIIEANELLGLKGGYSGAICYYICISYAFGILGCANSLSENATVGLINCRCCCDHETDYADGPYYPPGASCCTSW